MAKKKRVQIQKPAAENESDNDEIYDEVDKFHQERDKRILGDMTKEKKKFRQEEVLGVVASSDDSDEDDDDDMESDDSVDERFNKKKKGDLEFGVKSADAWGNKKLEFYGDRADKDWGGWDEDDAEALDLEEEDAITRQKKLDEGIEAVDFAGLLESDDEEEVEKAPKKKATEVKKDARFDSFTKQEQIDYFHKHSPSFDSFVKEYNDRRAQFDELKPTLESILSCMNDHHECPFTLQIKAIIAAYSQYLQSYLMFFRLKDRTPIEKFKIVENHPVLDDIMKQYPIVKQIDEFVEQNYRRLMKIADRLRDDPSYAHTIANPEPPKKKRRIEIMEDENTPAVEDISDVLSRMARGEGKKGTKVPAFGPALDDGMGEIVDDEKKRKITYEMQKNKGLTVRRKKTISHSRTKKREQYKKAVHIRRSQVPDVQREVDKYGGEKRGIRASVVKSIKLKA